MIRTFIVAVLCVTAAVLPAPAQSPKGARDTKAARDPGRAVVPQQQPQQVRKSAIAAVKSWSIQFRHLNLEQLKASPLDMIVMDHAPHPRKGIENPFQKAELEPLKKKPDGARRLVIAYLSIGEAERYRYYWKPEWDAPETRPAWLGGENPAWPANFLVKFRDPDWQSIIFGSPDSYLDRILGAGFDGVFLDRVDAFQDTGNTDPDLEDAMAGFVSRLSTHARRTNPAFLIIMQNAEELIRFRSVRKAIDAISKEDLLFGQDNSNMPNPKEMVRDSVQRLRQARRAGLAVFVLEYISDPVQRKDVEQVAKREGFVLRFAERSLSSLATDEPAAAPAPAPQP